MEAVRLKACRTVTMGSKITKQRARQTRDTIIPPGIRGNTTYINSTKDISSTKKRMPASGICTIHFRNTWRHRRPYSLGIESGSGYKHTHKHFHVSLRDKYGKQGLDLSEKCYWRAQFTERDQTPGVESCLTYKLSPFFNRPTVSVKTSVTLETAKV